MNLALLKEYTHRFINPTAQEWEDYIKKLELRCLKKGELLLEQGKICQHVYFINSGHFRSYTLLNGEEITQGFAFEGNYVTNYASFLTRQPSSESIVALADAELIALGRTEMHSGYDESHTWERYGRLIAEFIFIDVSRRNRDMLFLNPEQRYLKLMQDRPKVIDRIPLRYIASYLGVKPESLSRIRRRLANKP